MSNLLVNIGAQIVNRNSMMREDVNGHYVPSTELALKMARELDCTVEDLFSLPE